MVRMVLIATLVVLVNGLVAAEDTLQVRLPLTVTVSSNENDPAAAWSGWNDGRNAWLGVAPELIFDHVGVGLDAAARFSRDEAAQWSVEFRQQVVVSYHLFGVTSALDAWASTGLGAAGSVELPVRLPAGVDRSTVTPQDLGVKLALVPSVGAGLALDLGGLVVGARATWFLANWDVPAAPLAKYALEPLSVGVFVAWALVDHAP